MSAIILPFYYALRLCTDTHDMNYDRLYLSAMNDSVLSTDLSCWSGLANEKDDIITTYRTDFTVIIDTGTIDVNNTTKLYVKCDDPIFAGIIADRLSDRFSEDHICATLGNTTIHAVSNMNILSKACSRSRWIQVSYISQETESGFTYMIVLSEDIRVQDNEA